MDFGGGRTTELRVRPRAGGDLWVHALPKGWLATPLVITQHRFYWVEYNDDTKSTRLMTGGPGLALKKVKEYDRFIPEVFVVNDKVYTSTWEKTGRKLRSCALPVTEGSGSTNPLFCVNGSMERLHTNGDTLSFTSFAVQGDKCGSVMWVDLKNGATVHRAATAGCPFAGVATAAGTLWIDVPTPDAQGGVNYETTRVKARAASGVVVDLGVGSAGSATVCGTSFLWRTLAAPVKAQSDPSQDDPEQGDLEAIRSWSPTGKTGLAYEEQPGDTAPVSSGVSYLPGNGLLLMRQHEDRDQPSRQVTTIITTERALETPLRLLGDSYLKDHRS